MMAMGVYDQIKTAFRDIIAPELQVLRGDIQRLDQRFDSVDQRFDSVDQRFDSIDQRFAGVYQRFDSLQQTFEQRFQGLNEKIDDLDVRLNVRIDSLRTETVSMKGELLAEIRRVDTRIDGVDRELRTAIDIRERLAALEARRSP
jgi:hypothetical protein